MALRNIKDAILKTKLMVNNGGGLKHSQPFAHKGVRPRSHSANSDKIILVEKEIRFMVKEEFI